LNYEESEVDFVGNGSEETAEEIGILKFPVWRPGGFLPNPPKDTKLDTRVLGIF
jgi:hypothetical protein